MQRRWIDIGGPVFTLDFPGPRSGPTFVLVHGLGGCHANWLCIAPLLARTGRVISIDLPGFGLSPLAGRRADLQSARALIGRFIEDVVGAPAVLIGNSMGGALAAMQANEDPDSVSGLVLIAPALPRTGVHTLDTTVAGFLSASVIPSVGQALIARQVRALGAERLVTRTLSACGVDPASLPPDVIDAHLAIARERLGEPDLTAAFLQGARSLVRALGRRRRYVSALRAVTSPTLLIGGHRDRLVPRAAMDAIARVRPDWEYVMLDGSGHTPMLDEPLSVVGAIDAWLAGPASWILLGKRSLAGLARATGF